MAKGNAVWGIVMGQCALKALQCRPHEKEPRRLVVEAFDYIEYPKILTQPEAEPAELIREALATFLSRNDLTGSTVAISVGGQSGLMRFIKLPPVESKKIPDIVKYEARQQIPFSLDDVVWDYQQLTGGSEEDGFALEPEVGLFAMKRDQVARALAPLEEAGIEVDLIQLAPLAVYNYVCFDRLEEFQGTPYDPTDPPASTVVVSVGTDTTDLVVTNGYRVWQRNIPIGGNHFTRALSKELKLTFVKAEHLKRHATQADDPKAVFQAMRPVFSDLLAEIQRSLGYFMSLDKAAKIGEVIALGNAMKLPGLQRYLAQNLEQDVRPIEEFNRLVGGSAAGNAQFKDNILSFAPAYGLCIQGLGKGELKTNLLPEEIYTSRMVRSKKPWAVAGVAAVLAGLTVNYVARHSAWSEVNTKEQSWTQAISRADSSKSRNDALEATRTGIRAKADEIIAIQEKLTSNVEGRVRWLELLKAIHAALPKDDRPREETPEHVMSRREVHIVAIESQFFTDIGAEYFALAEQEYWKSKGGRPGEEAGGDPMAGGGGMGGEPLAGGDPMGAAAGPSEGAPTGEGWLIQLTGYHLHNGDKRNETSRFVDQTLLRRLAEGTVRLPDGPNGELIDVPIRDLAITHAWRLPGDKIDENYVIDPDAALYAAGGGPPMSYAAATGAGGFGALGTAPAAAEEDGDAATPPGAVDPLTGQAKSRAFVVKRYDFVEQFIWQPKTRAERAALAVARAEAEQAAAASDGGEDLDGAAGQDVEQFDESPPAEEAPPAEAAAEDLTATP
ncbi:MAG TPA: pilus assembly protein PilM [Lacipirellulaceae bacterium]|nr:pilus assembly protein PilM [Lacipirellulaceae bacterium]